MIIEPRFQVPTCNKLVGLPSLLKTAVKYDTNIFTMHPEHYLKYTITITRSEEAEDLERKMVPKFV